MVNGLFDFGNQDGLSFYAGGGAGRARVKFADLRDNAWAYQLIAGARYAISSNIDIGLKYRYFRTGKVELVDDSAVTLLGNANRFASFDQKFKSHSLLASLIFNFGAPPAPPPPPPPPPMMAAPPPPETQTCADGSVILATDSCPLPPPPPPPPPPAPERG